MNEADRIQTIYERLSEAGEKWEPTTLSHFEGQPFKALVASMLSAQTREEQTMAAMNALLKLADNPFDMLNLSDDQLREAIRPVAYAESKLRYLRDIIKKVAANNGEVPRTIEELVAYKGVGWKVAVLTLATGYGIYDDITVDVHVARIGRRLGLVKPEIKDPPKVNDALKLILPRVMWPYWNGLMVQFGRAVCLPTYPKCASCLVRELCPRVGVVEIGRGRFKEGDYM